jgi:Transglycosylase-like domain
MVVLAGTVALTVVAAPGVFRGRGAHASQADAVVTTPIGHASSSTVRSTTTTAAPSAATAAQVAAAQAAAQAQAAAAAQAAAEQAFLQRYASDPVYRMTVAYQLATPLQRLAMGAYLNPSPAPAAPAPPAAPSAPAPAVADGSVWDRIAACESGGNWSIHSGNGYSGGLQFSNSTWIAYGGQQFAPQAWQASREQQIVVAQRIHDAQGSYRAWPVCGRRA